MISVYFSKEDKGIEVININKRLSSIISEDNKREFYKNWREHHFIYKNSDKIDYFLKILEVYNYEKRIELSQDLMTIILNLSKTDYFNTSTMLNKKYRDFEKVRDTFFSTLQNIMDNNKYNDFEYFLLLEKETLKLIAKKDTKEYLKKFIIGENLMNRFRRLLLPKDIVLNSESEIKKLIQDLYTYYKNCDYIKNIVYPLYKFLEDNSFSNYCYCISFLE